VLTGSLALFVQHGELGAVALLVDRALGIHYFDRGDLYPMSEQTAGVASYLVAADGRIVGIIDSALLLGQVTGKLKGLIPQPPAPSVEAVIQVSHDGGADRVLTLRVGQDRFAIALDRIDRILAQVTISPLPDGGNGFSGMADVGEIPVPVLDLRQRLGDIVHPDASDLRPPCALVRLEGAVAGLVVDQVLRIVSIPRDNIDPVGPDHRLPISGVFEVGGEMVSMLMIDRLLPIMPVQ
jgi:chemotaxis signal transduction protein